MNPSINDRIQKLLLAPLFLVLIASIAPTGQAETSPGYPAVDAVFVKYCLDCHSHDDPDAGLNLETYDLLIKGGQNGSPIIAGDSDKSPLIRLLIGFQDPSNKTRIMPPGRRDKLEASEIQLVKAWIDQGAIAPPPNWQREINVEIPSIRPVIEMPLPIHSFAHSPKKDQLAVGRYQIVELTDPLTQSLLGVLEGHQGNVNGITFDPSGNILFAGAGEAGRFGEIKKWKIDTGELLASFRGHHDSVYALALSHDGRLLATGSYDQSIQIWNAEDGRPIRTLKGHQGAVYDLDFRADDKVLASASADRTIKLWNLASGERLDTLSQPLKEQHTVHFNRDGSKLFAAGVDNRIRVWSISPSARETTNPLVETRFAHEGTILQLTLSASGDLLASSATDRSVKIWETESLTERYLLANQPDWSPALAFFNQDQGLAIGRLDGSKDYYRTDTGQKAKAPQATIARLVPPGVQRGTVTRIRIEGKHLQTIQAIEFDSKDIQAAIVPNSEKSSQSLEVLVFSKETTTLGPHKLRVRNTQGQSNDQTFFVDRFPQQSAIDEQLAQPIKITEFPINLWGQIRESGQTDVFTFKASAGQQLVFDAAASQLGFKPDLVMTLAHENGIPIVSSQGFDLSKDPLLFYEFKDSNRYQIQITERLLTSSEDHFYRLSVGEFPYVTDTIPRMAPREATVDVGLVGYNLESEAPVTTQTGKGTQHRIELSPEVFRFRQTPLLELADWDPAFEREPNNDLQSATPLEVGQNAAGRIHGLNESRLDEDYYQFSAIEGQSLIIETIAEKLGSPLDTRIEILDETGAPIERLLLEAIRDTAITFRPITSTAGGVRLDHWEEMSLNDYLFMNGEVVKLFLAPRGPDSSWDFYPAQGTRRTYFDTTPTAHANFEPCYIVKAHPPGTKPIANGLPRFPLYYENDDHSEANKGRDSRVYFKAPKKGDYFVKVVDARQLESPRFIYHLLIREQAPDFDVTISNRDLSINRGSGRSFTVNRKRIDGFDGEIHIEITNLPPGLTASSPIVIEEGHHLATGTLFADESLTEVSALQSLSIEVTASANIQGRPRIKSIRNFGKLKVTEAPKLFVDLKPSPLAPAQQPVRLNQDDPARPTQEQDSTPQLPVITIQAGTTIPANLSVKRAGHEERITFTVSNLPHGVIVDNIGLNGVLMPPDVSEREIFLTAADWVEETERLCHAIANEAGGQTSRPVILKVVRSNSLQASSK